MDQMCNDQYLKGLLTPIKGRQNYRCVYDPYATCDVGVCQRVKKFDCPKLSKCPYWKAKVKALESPVALMSFSYFILENYSENVQYKFGNRNLLVLDECLPAGEMVWTKDGEQPIEAIKSNKVYGVNGNNLVETSVLRSAQTRPKDCIYIRVASGKDLECSTDHSLLDYKGGWVPAIEAKRIATITIPRYNPSIDAVKARLFGYALGDGWLQASERRHELGFSGEPEDLERIRVDMELLGFTTGEVYERDSKSVISTIKYDEVEVEGHTSSLIYSTKAGKYFKELGYPIGRKTDVLFSIPDWITFGSTEVKAEFLAGLMGAEGHPPYFENLTKRHIKCLGAIRLKMFKNKNLSENHTAFFEDLRVLFNDLGVETSPLSYREGNIRVDGSETFAIDLTIKNSKSNMIRFLKRIGYRYCRQKELKAGRVLSFLTEQESKLGRILQAYYKWRRLSVETNPRQAAAEISKLYNIPFNTVYGWRKLRRGKPSWGSLKGHIPKFENWEKKYCKDDITYELVTAKEPTGKKVCYNLTTSTENFVVNGILVHNSHDLDLQLLKHINLVVSPWTIPYAIYNKVSPRIREFETIDEVKAFIKVLTDVLKAHFLTYEQITLSGAELSIPQVKERNRVEDFVRVSENFFLRTTENVEWVWQLGWTSYRGRKHKTLTLMPVFSRFFTPEAVWSRADYFIISSATILDPYIFAYENGMDRVFKPSEILYLRVPSTFPPENRPIVDATEDVGKLTNNVRDKNLPKAVKVLENILDMEGNNIAVHCRSYDMMNRIIQMIDPKYKDRLIHHKSDNRKEAYEKWKNSRGKVFLCVAFEQGYNWVGDICRAQVLFKVPYLDIGDKRVARRLELKLWKWYFTEAIRESIQTYGRAVRSEDDYATFYVIDGAFGRLLRQTRRVLPKWFCEALPPEWRRLTEV